MIRLRSCTCWLTSLSFAGNSVRRVLAGIYLLPTVVRATACLSTALVSAQEPAQTDTFFQVKLIRKLAINVPASQVEKIGEGHRPYVRCEFTELVVKSEPTKLKSVAIKLKGAAGSFRDFNDRPALTLNTDKFRKGQAWYGLQKFHLNNSVQDETYLHEVIAADLFARAKYPATRVAFAKLELNGRDVGLYVVKEGFDRRFLERHFADSTGNFYDGGFCQDVDARLEKDAGNGPDDLSDIKAIADASRLEDPKARWAKLEQLIDLDKFYTFMAIERMLCHWDGYAWNKNNYRIYVDPESRKAIFIPHGMDQMFGDPNMSLFEHVEPIVSSAVMQNNAWRKAYRAKVAQLAPLFTKPDQTLKLIDEWSNILEPAAAGGNAEKTKNYRDRVNELKQRIKERATSVTNQLAEPEAATLEFPTPTINLPDWYGSGESEGVMHETIDLPAGKKALKVFAGFKKKDEKEVKQPDQQAKESAPKDAAAKEAKPATPERYEPCIGSWRRRVLLGPGTYRLEGLVMTSKLTRLPEVKRVLAWASPIENES